MPKRNEIDLLGYSCKFTYFPIGTDSSHSLGDFCYSVQLNDVLVGFVVPLKGMKWLFSGFAPNGDTCQFIGTSRPDAVMPFVNLLLGWFNV